MSSSVQGEEYVEAKISKVGYGDNLGLQGVVVLTSFDGKEFSMSAFSGEVARHISRFQEGDKNSIPTIYNLVEEIAVSQNMLLDEVHIYQSGTDSEGHVIRANLYFRNRAGTVILRNYRASDAIALAAYYDAPIKVRSGLFKEAIER